jgi:hypothetical protein
MGDIQQAALHHADDDKPVFAVRLTIIEPFNGKRVFECIPSRFKIDAVGGVILGGLGFVLFESIIMHRIYCLAVVLSIAKLKLRTQER